MWCSAASMRSAPGRQHRPHRVAAAGMPLGVPGTTIDRQCGSSQQAIHFAAQGVMSGTQDVVVVGGVQNMSAIPISQAMIAGQEFDSPRPQQNPRAGASVSATPRSPQFAGADAMAVKWDISREDMEQWAFNSHDRARTAIADGRFDREIVAYGDLSVDECPAKPRWRRWPASNRSPRVPRLTAAVASPRSPTAHRRRWSSRGRPQAVPPPRAPGIHHLSVRGDDR